MDDVNEALLSRETNSSSRNSVHSIKSDFISKLPEKVRAGVVYPNGPFRNLLDTSKIPRLAQGKLRIFRFYFRIS